MTRLLVGVEAHLVGLQQLGVRLHLGLENFHARALLLGFELRALHLRLVDFQVQLQRLHLAGRCALAVR
ncbi:hypothetical protein GO496_24525 [Acidovorax citrulli]|nr:hypothetical protein [Paracidovorax citrulli]